MRKGLILLLLAASSTACAQTIPSKEAFLNEVCRQLLDSPITKFSLKLRAFPCGFIKYNYDEWVKYNLKEDVPITVMDELAAKCYHDQVWGDWRQDSLLDAVCVGPSKTDSAAPTPAGPSLEKLTRQQRKAMRRQAKIMDRQPPESRFMYGISKPEFTDDGQYAIIEVVFDCGPLCASKSSFLFRRMGPDTWKMIGKCLDWQS